MEKRPPLFVSLKIFGDVSGDKNVSGIGAVHHALRHIKTGPGKVGLAVHIDHAADWATVHSHSKSYLRVVFESAADFEGAFHWLFRALVKNQRHPVSGRHPDQSTPRFGGPKTFGVSHDLIQLLEQLNLLIDQQFRVTDHVD